MYEGLITLLLNLVLSYLLIKNYGIVGAAIGNTVSMGIASIYVIFCIGKIFQRKQIWFFKGFIF